MGHFPFGSRPFFSSCCILSSTIAFDRWAVIPTAAGIGVELDEISILRRERVPAVQQGVNGFASVDEICGFFPNGRHGGSPCPLTV